MVLEPRAPCTEVRASLQQRHELGMGPALPHVVGHEFQQEQQLGRRNHAGSWSRLDRTDVRAFWGSWAKSTKTKKCSHKIFLQVTATAFTLVFLWAQLSRVSSQQWVPKSNPGDLYIQITNVQAEKTAAGFEPHSPATRTAFRGSAFLRCSNDTASHKKNHADITLLFWIGTCWGSVWDLLLSMSHWPR